MNDATAKDSSEIDARFVIIAGALLLLILALLSGLWLRMRSRALRAERDLARLRTEQRVTAGVRFSGGGQDLDAMLRQMAAGALRRVVQREDLKAEQVNLNGRDVRALHLPAETAEAIGFKPGDVIIVDEPPPTTATGTGR